MQYINCYKGRFLERPNRFIAYVDIDGQREKVHVKNTGRCKEILLPDVDVYLEKSDNPARSTAYDLVAARKGERIINIDSQAPNKAVLEWLKAGGLFPDLTLVRPETTFGNSRFDFYAEREGEKIFIEVKGVTQEAEDIVMFPDAPSDRAVKHVEELIQAKHAGYRVFVLFVIQMENVRFFTPNRQIHKEFADSLKKASEAGVEVIAYDCTVTEDSMVLHEPVEVRL